MTELPMKIQDKHARSYEAIEDGIKMKVEEV